MAEKHTVAEEGRLEVRLSLTIAAAVTVLLAVTLLALDSGRDMSPLQLIGFLGGGLAAAGALVGSWVRMRRLQRQLMEEDRHNLRARMPGDSDVGRESGPE